MAEAARAAVPAATPGRKTYPYLTTKAWWDIRRRFKTTMPKGEVNSGYLAGVLNVSEKATSSVIAALRSFGLIDESGRTTDRANAWRDDQQYRQVTAAMLEEVYPQELRDMAPPPNPDKDAVARWFMRETGAGEGAAAWMARLYALVAAGDPTGEQAGAERAQAPRQPAAPREARAGANRGRGRAAKPPSFEAPEETPSPAPTTPSRHPSPSVHIDIQVHIDPAASAEQIDEIFASMARHLYGRG